MGSEIRPTCPDGPGYSLPAQQTYCYITVLGMTFMLFGLSKFAARPTEGNKRPKLSFRTPDIMATF